MSISEGMPKAATQGAILRPYRGRSPEIAPGAFVAEGAVIVGAVHIAAEANIWYGCVLRGDDNEIRIGERSNIQDGTVIHVTLHDHPTLIGRDVVVGHGARLHGCTLEDECLVGIGAIVLDGAVVARGAMVAAGSVVPPGKQVPSGELWAGNPARRLREVRAEEREFILWDAGHYARLAREYAGGGA